MQQNMFQSLHLAFLLTNSATYCAASAQEAPWKPLRVKTTETNKVIVLTSCPSHPQVIFLASMAHLHVITTLFFPFQATRISGAKKFWLHPLILSLYRHCKSDCQ